MENRKKSHTDARNVMEFITVAVEYCAFLEQSERKTRMEFVDTITKLLPLLYLKTALLPHHEILSDYYPENFVTEENYNIVRENISITMGKKDEYLDVFMEDMKYSESPILTTVSENLTDIYQEIKNFVMSYKYAAEEELIINAVATMKNEFQYSWGQKLVNVMRPLHEAIYMEEEDDF